MSDKGEVRATAQKSDSLLEEKNLCKLLSFKGKPAMGFEPMTYRLGMIGDTNMPI
jgi:hypothetical protein